MATMSDAEIIAWARMLGDTWHQLFGDDSKAAYRFRRLADLAEKGAEDARLAAAIEAERAKGLSRTLQDFGDLRERRAAEERALARRGRGP